MTARIRQWWQQDGLGYTADIKLTEQGSFEVTFSCMPGSEIEDRIYNLDEAIPTKDRLQTVMAQYEARGFVLQAIPGLDVTVPFCDANRDTLAKLVSTTFPSAVMTSLAASGSQQGKPIIKEITVLIRNLADVMALPALVEAECQKELT